MSFVFLTTFFYGFIFHMTLITCDECLCIIMTPKAGTCTYTARRASKYNFNF